MSDNFVPAILKVSTLNGFMAKQRVSAQDVEARPVQHYPGTIMSIWSDGTADVHFDAHMNFEAEKHLVVNGRVELHHLTRIRS